jgi:hypothetical protein
MYVYVFVCVYTYIYIAVYVCVYVYIYRCACMCVFLCVCIYIYIYTCTCLSKHVNLKVETIPRQLPSSFFCDMTLQSDRRHGSNKLWNFYNSARAHIPDLYIFIAAALRPSNLTPPLGVFYRAKYSTHVQSVGGRRQMTLCVWSDARKLRPFRATAHWQNRIFS